MWKWLQSGRLATRGEILFWGGLVTFVGIYAVRQGFAHPFSLAVVIVGIFGVVQGVIILSYLKKELT